MKTNSNFFLISGCIALILVCAVIIAGCTSSTTPIKSDSPAASSTAIPVSTVQTPVQTPTAPVATSTQALTTTVSLSNGVVTITYPSDWEREVTSETSLRDYGRITTNIANFFSPVITPERASIAQPNVDKSKYTTLSIDVDPEPVSDFERYFNLAVLDLQKQYGHIDITKHNYQLKISGYKAYRLDFDTATNMRGLYIFTDVDGTVYIFAFKNPSPYSAETEEMYKSIKIISPVSTQKSR